MSSLGGLLVVFGLGSLALPLFNLQFRLMEWLDPYQPVAGIAVAAIGAVLLFLSMQRRRPAVAPAATEPPVAPTAQ